MYTAPAKVNVQAKKLIESFEKGEVTREEDEADGQKPNYPQMYTMELAQPGTAKKRMMELERLKKEAEAREKPTASSFEKGEVTREEDEEDGQKPNYPEMCTMELAQPGTAKKRLMELERLKKEAEAREKPTASTKKLSEEMYGDFAHDRMKGGYEGSRASGGSKNGVEHPRVEESREEHHEVFTTHEGRGDHVQLVRVVRTRILIVTSTGTGAESVMDRGLVDSVVRFFKDDDHEVHVTDLSHIKDHPVDYSHERSRVKEAQLVVFHFRPILHTVPAGLLDWLQNVLVEDFAFDRRNGKTFDNGLLKGKRSLLLVSLSDDKTRFDGDSPLGDFSQYLWPIQNGILRYVGFSVLTPHLTFWLHEGSHDALINEATEALTARLRNVWHEKPLFHEPK